mgnify:CR=1 FL=1
MPLTTAQLQTLKTELNSDPRSYGYAADILSGYVGGLRDKLNLARAGITIRRPDCDPAEILEAIDIRDFAASPAGVTNNQFTASWFESITQFARVRLANTDGTKTQVRKNIDRMVNDAQGSQTRLDAVAVRTGTRAEELFGAGVVVTNDDVTNALRS